MNEQIEKLLQPVSAEQPCGPDLADQPQFDELERLLKGKPEVEVGSVVRPGEPPDWRELTGKAAEYLAKSKHLRVAVMFCGGSLQTAGLGAFRDGLQLIRGLVEQYWAAVYPLLDVEDNNDPTQRLNILGALNAPRGTLMPSTQQWLGIIDYLYTAPLCQPRGAEALTLSLVETARGRAEGGAAEAASEDGSAQPAGMDVSQLKKAFHSAAPAEIEASLTAVTEALEALTALDQFLTQTLGAGTTISFDELHRTLTEMQSVLKTYSPGATSGAASAAGESETPGGVGGPVGGTPAAMMVSGSIQSREDVVRAIDAICTYYRQVEPSSPVPYLLRRAQKMAIMNFVEAMQELSLATPDTLRPSLGTAVDSDPLSG